MLMRMFKDYPRAVYYIVVCVRIYKARFKPFGYVVAEYAVKPLDTLHLLLGYQGNEKK